MTTDQITSKPVATASPLGTATGKHIGPQLRQMLRDAQDAEKRKLPRVVSEYPRIELVEEDVAWPENIRSISEDVDIAAVRFALCHLVPSNKGRIFRIPSAAHVHSFSEAPCYCSARHSVGGAGQGRVRVQQSQLAVAKKSMKLVGKDKPSASRGDGSQSRSGQPSMRTADIASEAGKANSQRTKAHTAKGKGRAEGRGTVDATVMGTKA